MTTLIEYAFNATDDKEKLAALANAKKIYQNSGIKMPPTKPTSAAPVPEVIPAPTVDNSKLEVSLMAAETLAARFQKQAADLRVENKELNAQLEEYQAAEMIKYDRSQNQNDAKTVLIVVFGLIIAIAVVSVITVVLL